MGSNQVRVAGVVRKGIRSATSTDNTIETRKKSTPKVSHSVMRVASQTSDNISGMTLDVSLLNCSILSRDAALTDPLHVPGPLHIR